MKLIYASTIGFTLLLGMINPIRAFNLQEKSAFNDEITYDIVASAILPEQNAVSAHMTVHNGQLIKFVPLENNFLFISTNCPNGSYIQNNNLCFDVAKVSTSIEKGEVLGTITVRPNKNESIRFSNEGIMYANTNQEQIVSDALSIVKETQKIDTPQSQFTPQLTYIPIVIIGVLVLLILLILPLLRFSNQKEINS